MVAAAGLALDQPQSSAAVLQELHLAAGAAPLNEAVHVALIRLLAARFRRSEAFDVFDVFDRVRRALADELGIEPGPELAQAFRDLGGGAVDMTVVPVPTPPPPWRGTTENGRRWPRSSTSPWPPGWCGRPR